MIEPITRPRITRKRVYISGPLTSSGDPKNNVARAMEIAHALIELGYAPLCPHLTHFLDPDQRIKHAVWMEIDLPWVSVSDAVLRFGGESVGADLEVSEAHRRGIPVYTKLAELMKGIAP